MNIDDLNFDIRKITDENIDAIKPLAEEALSDGDNFMKRTLDEWLNRKNNFSKINEGFWGIFIGNECIGIGGINIDPFIENNDGTIGRVRHVYILKRCRGLGLSKTLMNFLISFAKGKFKSLRLSTKNPIARNLYLSLGFTEAPAEIEGLPERVTYTLELK